MKGEEILELIYLDNSSTTKPCPKALEKVKKALESISCKVNSKIRII